ncbi:hypothetical protein Taro_019832, partial [Colocasia esculenta]|nr:hypothetical protein [Colocasia esculenta]
LHSATGHHPPPPTTAPSIRDLYFTQIIFVHTPVRGTALPFLLRLLPSEVVREQASSDADGDDLETHLADD